MRKVRKCKSGDDHMSTTDTARQLEAEDLARAKSMTQNILGDWDWLSWNELLADDVVLSLKLGSIGIDRIGGLAAAGGNLQVEGREDAKSVLKSIYDDMMRGLSVTTEILSGYNALLLGTLTLELTKETAVSGSWPIVIYMEFNPYGRISVMTIAAVDLQPLTDAIRNAAQTSALKAA
jgi:hypothetical protein